MAQDHIKQDGRVDIGGKEDVTSTKTQKPLSTNEDAALILTDQDGVQSKESHDLYERLVRPTGEQRNTLRKVAGKMPAESYWLCIVEFAERASYYGCSQVYKNFIRAPLPAGSTTGAAPRGSEITAGALGKGSVTATAMTEAFSFMAYAFPVLFGWLADTKYGRFKMICWGVGLCGIAHVVMIISSVPSVLTSGHAIGPFALSLYMLAVGAAMFKPCITPTIMDQSPHKVQHVVTDEDGELVLIDPEASLNSVMLYFYMLINIGSCFGIATSYLAKDVGFWSAYLLPCIIYFLLPPLLWYLNKRLVKQPPGGSDLGNVFKVLADIFRQGGIKKLGRKGLWELAYPSKWPGKIYGYDDQFVDDVRRTFQACGIFLFFPIFNINDGGLGAAANALTASLKTNGVPNDLLDNLNPVSIVIVIPLVNHGLYPLLRKHNITWGPISRITFGFALCTIGSLGFTILQYFVYQTSPCGYSATTCSEIITDGSSTVAPISLGYYSIPIVLCAISEIFVNVTAYSIAYSRSPKNMKGLVASINLFMSAISSAIGLAAADAIQDPHLVWAFAGPTIAGAVSTVVFWFLFRHLDKEEFVLNTDLLEPARTKLGDIEEVVAEKGIGEIKVTTKKA